MTALIGSGFCLIITVYVVVCVMGVIDMWIRGDEE